MDFKKKNIGIYLKDSLGISYDKNFINSSIQKPISSPKRYRCKMYQNSLSNIVLKLR